MNRPVKEMQRVLHQSLGLNAIRQLPADHHNTHWVGTVDPALFTRWEVQP